MSDNRLGINVGVSGVSQSEAELNRLKGTVGTLRDAIANLGRSNMGGSSDLTKNLTAQLRAAEAQLKTFQTQLISTYSSADTFSIRAIAAMRGQADAIKGVARELSDLDRISRSHGGGNIWTSTVQDALASKMNFASVSAREHAARQKELEEAFSATGDSASRAVSGINAVSAANLRAANSSRVATNEMRHMFAIADSAVAGRRGQMFASTGAMLRDSGVGGAGLAAGAGAFAALIGTGAILKVAEQLGKLNEQIKAGSEAVGMSVHQYAQIQGALTLVGDKAEAADAMMRHFATSVEKATANPKSEQAKAFDAAKIFPDELKAKGADTFAMLQRVSQALRQFADDGTKAAFLSEIFGRNDAAVVKLMQDFDGLTERADKYADSVDKNIDTATKMNDKLNELSLSWHTLEEEAAVPLNFVVNITINGLALLESIPGKLATLNDYMYDELGKLGNLSVLGVHPFAGTAALNKPFGYDERHNTGTDIPSTTLPDVQVGASKPHMQPFSAPNARGGGGGNKDYTAFADQQRADLEASRGNWDQQSAILDNWRAKAASTFKAGSAEYIKAMADIQRASQEATTRIIADMERAGAAMAKAGQDNLRGFERNVDSLVKTHQISPEQGYGFDIQKAYQVHQDATASLQSQMSAADKFAGGPAASGQGNEQQTQIFWKQWDSGTAFDSQIAELQDKLAAAGEKAAEVFKQPWASAFSEIGNSLETTIAAAIKTAWIPQKPEYSWTSSTGPGGIPLMHAHRISPTAQLASQFGLNALQDVGKAIVDNITSGIAKALSGGATSSISQLLTNALFKGAGSVLTSMGATTLGNAVGGMAGGAASGAAASATVVAAVTTTGQETTASIVTMAQELNGTLLMVLSGILGLNAKPSVLGTTYATGGIVTAASGMLTPRTFGTDSVLSALTPGERVLNVNDTAKLDRFLNAGPQQASGDMHLHFHGPADAPSMDRWFRNMMSSNPNVVRQFFRQNALTPRSL